MEKYLGIIYLLDGGVGPQTFCLSREVDTKDKDQVTDFLMAEAHTTMENIDTILLVANGVDGDHPMIIESWTASEGDFSYRDNILDDKDDYDDDEDDDDLDESELFDID